MPLQTFRYGIMPWTYLWRQRLNVTMDLPSPGDTDLRHPLFVSCSCLLFFHVLLDTSLRCRHPLFQTVNSEVRTKHMLTCRNRSFPGEEQGMAGFQNLGGRPLGLLVGVPPGLGVPRFVRRVVWPVLDDDHGYSLLFPGFTPVLCLMGSRRSTYLGVFWLFLVSGIWRLGFGTTGWAAFCLFFFSLLCFRHFWPWFWRTHTQLLLLLLFRGKVFG